MNIPVVINCTITGMPFFEFNLAIFKILNKINTLEMSKHLGPIVAYIVILFALLVFLQILTGDDVHTMTFKNSIVHTFYSTATDNQLYAKVPDYMELQNNCDA
jgi:hypothetical protein